MSTDTDLPGGAPVPAVPGLATTSRPADIEPASTTVSSRGSGHKLLSVTAESDLRGSWTEVQACYVEDVQDVNALLQEICDIVLGSVEEVDGDRPLNGGGDYDNERLRTALRENCSYTDVPRPRRR